MTTLPTPEAETLAHSQQLLQLIQNEIRQSDGWIDFARFMHLALYQPSLGYYSGGAKKFGQAGDFVTAPEISPLFAQTLAQQVFQILSAVNEGDILELGAGTGRLAWELLLELQTLNKLPTHYYILDVSAHLQAVQRETLQSILPAELMQRVVWLDKLPTSFKGMVLANEVLDALPVHLIGRNLDGLFERGVTSIDQAFSWQDKPLPDGALFEAANALNLPQNYLSEICPAAPALIASLAEVLQQGAMLWIDYGFSAQEYYHPQRSQGTLMCHYRHYAHDDPLIHVGLQDITAHVDFTAIAQAGIANDLSLAGYTTQAQFLINCGITQVMSRVSAADTAKYLPLAAQAQKLLSPAEMGELFKVIGFTKGLEIDLLGFVSGDKSYAL